jgi:hypothetical protein
MSVDKSIFDGNCPPAIGNCALPILSYFSGVVKIKPVLMSCPQEIQVDSKKKNKRFVIFFIIVGF